MLNVTDVDYLRNELGGTAAAERIKTVMLVIISVVRVLKSSALAVRAILKGSIPLSLFEKVRIVEAHRV